MNVSRLFDFPYYQLENKPLSNSIVSKVNGKWVETSTQEYINKANTISRALLKMGVKPNDKIAIISSSNRTEWNILDIGILQTGAQTIPIYPTSTKENFEYILNHSEVTYCFLSDAALFDKAKSIQHNVPTLKEIFSFEDITGCKHWDELFDLGKDTSNQIDVEERKNNVNR